MRLTKTDLKQLDPKSKEFMLWVEGFVNDEEEWNDLKNHILNKLNYFLDWTSKKLLQEQLKNKMIKGSKEHGEPKLTIKEVEAEIKQEWLDLLGWTCMQFYIAEKGKNVK